MTEEEGRLVVMCVALIFNRPNPYTRADQARVKELGALAKQLDGRTDVDVDVAALLPKVPAVCAAMRAKDSNAVEIALVDVASVLAPLFRVLVDQIAEGRCHEP